MRYKRYIKYKPMIIRSAFMNAIKRLSIAEHLIKNPNCADHYEEFNFKILRQCSTFSDLIKLEEETSFHLNKPKLC